MMSPNHLLRRARQQCGWSQAVVADHLQTTAQQISRWERGETHPSPHFCAKLCALFSRNAESLGLLPQESSLAEKASPVLQASASLADSQLSTPISISDAVRPCPDIQPDHIIGREHYLTSLLSQLGKGTTCVLFGLPGIGKSTLAHMIVTHTEFASYFPSGFLWIGLGPSPQVTNELIRLATILGVPEQERSQAHSREDWSRLLHQALERRRMLLIIDDAWAVDAVLPFLIGGPAVAHLVTTRQPQVAFALPSADQLSVPELSPTESLTLLTTLVPALGSLHYDQLEDVLSCMGGLPLAITLLGRYLRTQSVGGQPRRLIAALSSMTERAHRLQLTVAQPPVTFSFSHQANEAWSLATVIRLSDEHLSPEACDAFYALSVLPAKPDRFSEQAALAVSGQDETMLDTLLDAGLLEGVEPGWYTLHQTIADYGRQSLSSLRPWECLVAYAVRFVDEHRGDVPAVVQEYATLLTALEATVQHQWHQQRFHLVEVLNIFWVIQCLYESTEKHLTTALATAQYIEDPIAQVSLLCLLASRANDRTDYEQAERLYQEGLSIARRKKDHPYLLEVLRGFGALAIEMGNQEHAENYYQECLTLAVQAGNLPHQAMLHNNLGDLLLRSGCLSEAERRFRISLPLMRQISAPRGTCLVLTNLGDCLQAQGHLNDALVAAQEALSIAEKGAFFRYQCRIYPLLGALAWERGAIAEAQYFFETGLALARHVDGIRDCIVSLLAGLALVKLHVGKSEEARDYLLRAEQVEQMMKDVSVHAALSCAWANVLLAQQHYEEAQRRLLRAHTLLPLWQERALADVEYALAQVARAQGNEDDTNYWGRQSLDRFVRMGHAQAPKVRQWLDESHIYATSAIPQKGLDARYGEL